MKVPSHITSLSRRDFEEIAKAANLTQGEGVIVESVGNRYVVRIDVNWLNNWVRNLIYGSDRGL